MGAERGDLIALAKQRYESYDQMWNVDPPGDRQSPTRMSLSAVACADLLPALLAEIERLKAEPGYRKAIADLRDGRAFDEWRIEVCSDQRLDSASVRHLAAQFLESRLAKEGESDGA